MLGRQVHTVHREGEQHLRRPGRRQWQAPLVVLFDTAFDAVIGTGEHHLHGGVVDARPPRVPPAAESRSNSAVPTASIIHG